MQLIPQIYLKGGKVVLKGGARSALLAEDPLETARALKSAGADSVHVMDLSATPIGTNPNVEAVRRIRKETGLVAFVDGLFKTAQSVDEFIKVGAECVALGTIAYQQPAFLEEMCRSFPGKIAVHIDVKGNHVTIPGYAVVSNKGEYDYAEQFLRDGVRYIFYSNARGDGTIGDENIASVLAFCQKVTARVVCTSDVQNLSEIEKLVKLGAPRLEGIVVARALQEDRIDLRSAIVMVNDLIIESGNEETLAEL
jgi:phosphoribosylformimino-5-aminoimidazole carboxamide ribotide isomerase